MAPRIRNISPDEFRRLFRSPEIQSPGLTVSDAVNLSNALEQRRKTDLEEERLLREELLDFQKQQQELQQQQAQQEQVEALGRAQSGVIQAGGFNIPAEQIQAPVTKEGIQVAPEQVPETTGQQILGQTEQQLTTELAPEEAIKARIEEEAAEAQFQRDLALEREKSRGQKLDLTPGEKQLDREFAKTIKEFNFEGGAVGAASKIGKLKNAQNSLENLMAQPGVSRALQRGIAVLPESIRSFAGPQLQEIEQDARSAVTSLLRATLGAQFTEQEGERIFSQTFNPKAPMAINLRRLQLLTKTLEETAAAKTAAVEFFKNNRTIKGFDVDVAAAQQRVRDLADSFKDSTPKKGEEKSSFKIIGRRPAGGQ